MSYKYLQDYIYYSELYDKLTIEKCQCWEKSEDLESLKDKNEAVAKVKKDFFEKCFIPTSMYFFKGDRYLEKEKTVTEWMKRDQKKDDQLENATEPKGVRCLNCSSPRMKCISRDLMSDNGKDAVLFMFECEKCGKRRSYWESGKEWECKPTLCPKCKTEMQSSSIKKENSVETINTCPHCQHKDVDIFDLNIEEDSVDPNFEANRKKYCLSEEEGRKYGSTKVTMESVGRFMGDWKKREQNQDVYDAVGKIKKLTIVELQALLNPLLEKGNYAKLEFGKPEINKDLILEFSLQDNQLGRVEYDSIRKLKKLIKDALATTNWRLMGDGPTYRLGFISGRLRGVEGEENLRKLVEKTKSE